MAEAAVHGPPGKTNGAADPSAGPAPPFVCLGLG